MNPSKENAILAQAKLNELMRLQFTEGSEPLADFIMEFIRVAQRKLPTEATISKDRLRKRTKKSNAES